MAVNAPIEPIVGEVQQADPVIRASIVEFALKNAFINTPNTPKRQISADINDNFASFTVFFQRDEVFLRELFCGHLFSNGVKFHKDESGIHFKADKNLASFLNAVFLAVKDFNNQMVAMESRPKTVFAISSTFFSGNKPQTATIYNENTPTVECI